MLFWTAYRPGRRPGSGSARDPGPLAIVAIYGFARVAKISCENTLDGSGLDRLSVELLRIGIDPGGHKIAVHQTVGRPIPLHGEKKRFAKHNHHLFQATARSQDQEPPDRASRSPRTRSTGRDSRVHPEGSVTHTFGARPAAHPVRESQSTPTQDSDRRTSSSEPRQDSRARPG